MVKRAVFKDGRCNVQRLNIPTVNPRSWSEVYVSLVELRLSTLLIAFSIGFVVCWLFFALLWYLVAYFRGDLDLLSPEYLARLQESNGTTWRPCVEDITGFTSCFLFSLETLTTIGGGNWYPNEDCLEGIILIGIQVLVGMIVEGFLVGLIFAKLIEPQRKNFAVLFSDKAVVMVDEEEDQLAVVFRVGNLRKSHILAVQIHAHVIWHHRDALDDEGMRLEPLAVVVDSTGDRGMLFLWPLTVIHRIDADSPFYSFKPNDFLTNSFEIVAVLEGVVETTGQSLEARTSYLPHELRWGYRFVSMFKDRNARQQFLIDFPDFEKVEPCEPSRMPNCSAKDRESVLRVPSCKDAKPVETKHCACCTLKQRQTEVN